MFVNQVQTLKNGFQDIMQLVWLTHCPFLFLSIYLLPSIFLQRTKENFSERFLHLFCPSEKPP